MRILKSYEMFLTGSEIVEKRNILNELLTVDMTLQEMRLFAIYLSKINVQDISTRTVRISLSDFQRVMKLDRLNIKHLHVVTSRLLSRIINIPAEAGSVETVRLFKECHVDKQAYHQDEFTSASLEEFINAYAAKPCSQVKNAMQISLQNGVVK